jgi:DNA-binding Lrp family transcriptional regulator
LLKDGRKNFIDIAKECGVSRNKVWKHYGEMKKAGVITGATIQMDYRSFGYNAVASLLVNVESEHADQVTELIRKMPNIHAAYPVNARYNVRVIAILKSLNELDHVKEAIRRQKSVVDLKTYIWTDIKNIPENLAIGPFQKAPDKIYETLSPPPPRVQNAANNIDEIDMQIVDKLVKNGRASFKKISEEIGTSTDTVIKRYQKLRESGVIKVTIQIDPAKIGYQAILNFSLASSQDNLSAIVEELAKIPDVVVIIKASGDYDIYAITLIRDIKQLLAIHDEVAAIPGITRIETDIGRTINMWPTPCQYISTF